MRVLSSIVENRFKEDCCALVGYLAMEFDSEREADRPARESRALREPSPRSKGLLHYLLEDHKGWKPKFF